MQEELLRLEAVNPRLLMETIDDLVYYLKDSLAENVRLEHRLKKLHEAFNVPEKAMDTVGYIQGELLCLEGYQAYVDMWHNGKDPLEEKFYRHILERMESGTDIKSDILIEAFPGSDFICKACYLIVHMGIAVMKIRAGENCTREYHEMENELLGILKFYEKTLTDSASLLRDVIHDRDALETEAVRNADLMARIKEEVMSAGFPITGQLSALLKYVPDYADEDLELPW